jgi:hypothetical protein
MQVNSPVIGRIKIVAYTVGVVVLALAGFIWYVNSHYSFVYDRNFKTSCMAQGANESTCGCALDVLKQNYSFSTARSIEKTGDYPQALIDNISNSCS